MLFLLLLLLFSLSLSLSLSLDLTMIAIGIGDTYDRRELELIATDPSKHVFTSANFDALLQLVAEMRNRTCMGR